MLDFREVQLAPLPKPVIRLLLPNPKFNIQNWSDSKGAFRVVCEFLPTIDSASWTEFYEIHETNELEGIVAVSSESEIQHLLIFLNEHEFERMRSTLAALGDRIEKVHIWVCPEATDHLAKDRVVRAIRLKPHVTISIRESA